MIDKAEGGQPEGWRPEVRQPGAWRPGEWRRSSRCADASCVEVSSEEGAVLVRSTVEPDVELRLTAEQWRSLLDTVKADGFGVPDPGDGPYASTT